MTHNLFAEFLGDELPPIEKIIDWNYLMKVVEYIEKLEHQKFGRFKVMIQDDGCTIQATNRTKENTYSKSYYSESKINSVIKSIELFIEWFNNKIK